MERTTGYICTGACDERSSQVSGSQVVRAGVLPGQTGDKKPLQNGETLGNKSTCLSR